MPPARRLHAACTPPSHIPDAVSVCVCVFLCVSVCALRRGMADHTLSSHPALVPPPADPSMLRLVGTGSASGSFGSLDMDYWMASLFSGVSGPSAAYSHPVRPFPPSLECVCPPVCAAVALRNFCGFEYTHELNTFNAPAPQRTLHCLPPLARCCTG